jgi:hypothetical protein
MRSFTVRPLCDIQEAIDHLRKTAEDAQRDGPEELAVMIPTIIGAIEWATCRDTPKARIFARTLGELRKVERREQQERT